jgi:uncharacterized flavoprotein (TIGR03862 family)
MPQIPHVVIIGGGPAGLMAATRLAHSPVRITLIDQKPAVGRKFLVAGDGGFNLTHSEALPLFLSRYNTAYIRDCVKQFTSDDFREWLHKIGVPTFVGSSGKVFPEEGIKPIEVLNAWLKVLAEAGVKRMERTMLTDFDSKVVHVHCADEDVTMPYDYLVLGLGGASWSKTGSDGRWLELLREKGVSVTDFQSSNAGLELKPQAWWGENEGVILKNIRLIAGDVNVPGDCVITSYGIEGKPAYAVNRPLRENGFTELYIDCKPQLSVEHIAQQLRQSKTVREVCRKLRIPEVLFRLFRETLPREIFTDAGLLAQTIRKCPLPVAGLRPLDEAISTVGGVCIESLTPNGELLQFENVFCCGEMIDWDAPTGGYLIQGCVSSGFVVGQTIAQRL